MKKKYFYVGRVLMLGCIAAPILSYFGVVSWGIDGWNNYWGLLANALGAGAGGFIAYQIATEQISNERRATIDAILVESKLKAINDLQCRTIELDGKYGEVRGWPIETDPLKVPNLVGLHNAITSVFRYSDQLSELVQLINEPSVTKQYADLQELPISFLFIQKEIVTSINDVKHIPNYNEIADIAAFANEQMNKCSIFNEVLQDTKKQIYEDFIQGKRMNGFNS